MKNQDIIIANGIFSSLSGLVVLFLTVPTAYILGIEPSIYLKIIGGNLVLFGTFLIYLYRKTAINGTMLKIIIALDWLWVVGSIILIFLNPYGLSDSGKLIVTILAMIVLIFAVLQIRAK